MPETYYWDTCVFIAWLKNEGLPNRSLDEIEGIRDVVSKIEKGTVKLITSAITIAEMLECDMPPGATDLFKSLLQRRMMVTISVDIKVAGLASNLRSYYKKSKEHEKTLCTPDALHLATAILYKADEFHTFDGSNKKSLGLLNLGGDVGGYPLIIRKPKSAQFGLDLTMKKD